MTVSIILATKDRRDFLPTAIASVMAQTDPDWQLVVLDNGESVADLIPDDPRILYRHSPATGPADAYAQALALASGEYVMPLADDDWLAPETVAVVKVGLDEHWWGYALTDYTRDGRSLACLGNVPWDLDRLRHEGYYLGGAVFWRKELTDRLGGFNPAYDHAADWELYLRFGEHAKPAFVRELVYRYTDWEGTDTRAHNNLQQVANAKVLAR